MAYSLSFLWKGDIRLKGSQPVAIKNVVYTCGGNLAFSTITNFIRDMYVSYVVTSCLRFLCLVTYTFL